MRKDRSLTFIQIICAFSVVTMHTNGWFHIFSNTEAYWPITNVIESVCKFAVPLFFMITGITLLDYKERYSTEQFFKRRVEKTLIPYIVWCLMAILFRLITSRLSKDALSAKWIIHSLLSMEGIVDYFWFFKPLFCMYLRMPLYASVQKGNKQKVYTWVAVLLFIGKILIPFLNTVFKLNLGWGWTWYLAPGSGYVFLILIGWILYHYPPQGLIKLCMYIMSIGALVLVCVGTYKLSMTEGKLVETYGGYTDLPVIVYSLGAFVFLRNIGERITENRHVCHVVDKLGMYTFPLYLLHYFVICLFKDITGVNTKSTAYILLTPYLVFAVVIVITWIIRRIPVFRKTVP